MSARVVVLGGGVVGSAAAFDLGGLPDVSVTVVDARPQVARAAGERFGVVTAVADLSDPAAVAAFARDADLVVGALPSPLGYGALRAVIGTGTPCVDVSFMPEDARQLGSEAERHRVLALVDCGIAPGLSNLLLGWAASALHPLERAVILVGGLPAERVPPFEYKAPFSPFDVIEEYIRPCRLVEDGRVVVKEALSEIEPVELPGVGALEAFNTDGLRSLVDTIDAPHMVEKTLRYPGHAALMRAFRDAGFFSKDPVHVGGAELRPIDATAAILFPKWRYEPGERDLTVMRVRAEGRRGSKRVRTQWDVLDHFDEESGLSSMARCTGFVATALARRVLDGTLSGLVGVHPPEALGPRNGLLAGVMEDLRGRGIQIDEHTDVLG